MNLFKLSLAGLLAALLAAPVMAGAAQPPCADPFACIRQIDAGELNVGYVDAGPADGRVVILLHGWPYDIHSYTDVLPMLTGAGYRVLVPYLRGFGTTRLRAADGVPDGEPAAGGADVIAFMDALKIDRAILAGFDWGARNAAIVAALWPERVQGLVAVSGYLIGSQQQASQPLAPEAELQWWYQFYFATERGRAGYAANRHAFARLIWQQASPRWQFDSATFERSAAALDNPDHVAITISNYRWRLGLEASQARYQALAARLASLPPISVPTITLESDANGAPHAAPQAYAQRFTGPYRHQHVSGGIGHNLPQEAPRAFADAVIAVAQF